MDLMARGSSAALEKARLLIASAISLIFLVHRGKREEYRRHYCLLWSCSFAVRSDETCPHDL